MLFQHSLIENITSGRKTQTRRPVPPGEELSDGKVFSETMNHRTIVYRVRYAIGQSYAVQPGRGKPGIIIDGKPLRIEITDIRREDVRTINHADVRAEGFMREDDFFGVWCRIYDAVEYQKRLTVELDPVTYYASTTPSFKDWLARRPAVLYQAWALTFKVVI